jgi:hypothetical protein
MLEKAKENIRLAAECLGKQRWLSRYSDSLSGWTAGVRCFSTAQRPDQPWDLSAVLSLRVRQPGLKAIH